MTFKQFWEDFASRISFASLGTRAVKESAPTGGVNQIMQSLSKFFTVSSYWFVDHFEFLCLIGFSYFALRQAMKLLEPGKDSQDSGQERAQELVQRLARTTQRPITELTLTSYEAIIANDLILPSEITVTMDDIGGLGEIKESLKETLLLPLQHPELFSGGLLTGTPSGILLYGPPGTGKTMLAKSLAQASQLAFINLNIASLCNKYFGESEKFVQATFSLAQKLQPCIIFLDEIDSMLRKRRSNEHEVSTRIKSLFMSLWDGLLSEKMRVTVIGATNRPEHLDEAILRRMPLTFHVPLPSREQRIQILKLMLKNEKIDSTVDFGQIAAQTNGFSGSDLKSLCQEAARGPIRTFMRSGQYNTLRAAINLRNQSNNANNNNNNNNNNNINNNDNRHNHDNHNNHLLDSENNEIRPQLRPLSMDDFVNARRTISPTGEAARRYGSNRESDEFTEANNFLRELWNHLPRQQ